MFEQIRSSLGSGLGRVVAFVPNLISALVIVAIGYLLSRFAGTVVRRVLARVGFDGFVARRLHPRAGAVGGSPSAALGTAVFWLGLLITASMTARSLELYAISGGLNRILAFVPNVLVAAIILAVGAAISRFVGMLLAGTTSSAIIPRVARGAVIVLAVFMALDQLGVARNIVTTTFIAVLGAAAVALAIAFGIGNIPVAREYTQRWARRGGTAVQPPVVGGTTPATSPPTPPGYINEPAGSTHHH